MLLSDFQVSIDSVIKSLDILYDESEVDFDDYVYPETDRALNRFLEIINCLKSVLGSLRAEIKEYSDTTLIELASSDLEGCITPYVRIVVASPEVKI